MFKLSNFVEPAHLKFIKPNEKLWLENTLEKYSGLIDLENLWKIMDEIWEEFDCDQNNLDLRVDSFYSHPVWLLNGLFTEQQKESILNRQAFSQWICAQKPNRVADFGGGFGSLARLIAKSDADIDVEILEPHPHKLALEKAKYYKNLSYQKQLKEKYDVLIAIDVFEHVLDPLSLVAKTSMSLKDGGKYLIANCFQPVMKCHLPQHYHFFHTFNHVLKTAGFNITDRVKYGTVFTLNKKFNLKAARKIEIKSKKLWNLTKNMPVHIASILTKFLI